MDLLESISSLPEESFSSGDLIIREGEDPEKLYFLKSGRFEVIREEVRIALIKTPGSVIGEMSLLLETTATATVRAVEDSVFFVADNPLEFLSSHPRANLLVSRLLAHRLNAASQYLVDVREQLEGCSDHVGMVDGVLDAILHRDLKRKVSGA